jgi:hypothetical protein
MTPDDTEIFYLSKRKFNNALRIMKNIDGAEFLAAIHGSEEARDILRSRDRHGSTWLDWVKFRDNPWAWFIQASDESSDAIWVLVEERNRPKR